MGVGRGEHSGVRWESHSAWPPSKPAAAPLRLPTLDPLLSGLQGPSSAHIHGGKTKARGGRENQRPLWLQAVVRTWGTCLSLPGLPSARLSLRAESHHGQAGTAGVQQMNSRMAAPTPSPVPSFSAQSLTTHPEVCPVATLS